MQAFVPDMSEASVPFFPGTRFVYNESSGDFGFAGCLGPIISGSLRGARGTDFHLVKI
jgi:hypothetical protein